MITHRLVVSYTTFSPLPRIREAVLFFYLHLLSPIASIFGSGAPYAARTFLLHIQYAGGTSDHCLLYHLMTKREKLYSV